MTRKRRKIRRAIRQNIIARDRSPDLGSSTKTVIWPMWEPVRNRQSNRRRICPMIRMRTTFLLFAAALLLAGCAGAAGVSCGGSGGSGRAAGGACGTGVRF
jgi:hypothetical protein